MKRVVIILIAILVVLFAALSIISVDSEYAAEKLFYKAMRTYSKILINPDVIPPAMFRSVENDLSTLLKKYPNTVMAKTANISLSELYVTGKRYQDAQSVIRSAMSKYKDDVIVMSILQFMKGAIYEKMKQWDKALVEFRILMDKYPCTQTGLQVPLRIGSYYKMKGDEAALKDAYKEAVKFYKKIERDNSGKMPGYMASMLLIQSYINLEDYESAGAALEAALIKYPSSSSFNQLLPLIEKIYVEKLNSAERAVALYKKAETMFKGGGLKSSIDKRIAILEKSKK